jgi:hypothetical protein
MIFKLLVVDLDEKFKDAKKAIKDTMKAFRDFTFEVRDTLLKITI